MCCVAVDCSIIVKSESWAYSDGLRHDIFGRVVSLLIMSSLFPYVIAVILLFETSNKFAWGQWNPNDPIQSEPQWVKPRQKRTSGADEPWPPWLPPECPPDLQSYCMLPPYYPYDEVRRTIPNVGVVTGRSMAYKPYRYINLYLGVPYAKPPVYERRFKVCHIELYVLVHCTRSSAIADAGTCNLFCQ